MPGGIFTRKDLEAKIIAKAWRSPEYLHRLKRDARGVLQEELRDVDPRITLPESLQVHVHEESPTQYHLVIPRNPRDISLAEAVGEQNLEAVAPQTVAVVVVVAGIGVVVGNTAAAVNNVGAGNVVAAGNVATTGNAVANFNTVA
jgi:hypothetical protein